MSETKKGVRSLFGNLLLETNAAASDRFKFTGREFQSELGLYYYRARFYDPGSGRFVSQDPIGFNGGDQNLYGYVGNRVTTSTDPSGNIAISSSATATELVRIGVALASGFSGFALGYTCGYLNAVTVQGLSGEDATFQAQRIGLLVGSIDFASGIIFQSRSFGAAVQRSSLGARAAVGLFAAGVTALGFVNAVSNEDPIAGTIDGICFAVSGVAGIGIGRATRPLFLRGVRLLSKRGSVADRTLGLLLGGRGINVTSLKAINNPKFLTIGGGGRTFVTDVEAIENIIGPLQGSVINISRTQAGALESAFGLNPGSLQNNSVITVVDNLLGRAARIPGGGNDFFLGVGRGLPGGGPELTITGVPSNGVGPGLTQIGLNIVD